MKSKISNIKIILFEYVKGLLSKIKNYNTDNSSHEDRLVNYSNKPHAPILKKNNKPKQYSKVSIKHRDYSGLVNDMPIFDKRKK